MKKNLYTLSLFGILFTLPIFTLAQLSNDDLANAVQISMLPFSDIVLAADGQSSTSEVDEEICESDNGTWWYEFTPSITGDYIIKSEVTGSGAEDDTDDVRLGIYTGIAHPLTEIFCFDEDDGDGFGEDERVELTGGITYFIQIAPRDASVILDVTTSIIPFNTWTGAVDSDWTNASNWSLGSIPTANSLVQIIGTPSNQPIIDGTIEALASFIALLDGNDLTVAAGSKLTIITDELDGINLNHPNSTLQIDGQLFIAGAEDDGIDVNDGVLTVNANSSVQIQDCDVAIEIDNEATHTINGAVLLSNLAVDGIAIEDGSTLNIGSTATINIDNIGFDAIFLDDSQAIINISGTVQLSLAESGINVEDGTLNVGETGEVTITNTSFGIELEEDNVNMIDGQVTLLDIDTDGIALRDKVTLNIGENAVVDISFVGFDGIFMTPPNVELNINGSVLIEEIDEDGIDVVAGTVNVGSTGTVHVSKIGDNGIEDIIGSNAGKITVTNVVDEAFKTGNGTFTNESTGTIDLSNAGEDCMDIGATLDNNGIVITNNCDNLTIVDGTFNNNANAILQADGLISSNSVVFAANSILEPGTSPGCLSFSLGEDFSGTTLRFDIEGKTVCVEYDNIELTNVPTLTDATLELTGSYVPQIGDEFLIIQNDGNTDPVIGTFSGLSEGASIIFNNAELIISYMGGNGNDVTLTVNSILPVELLSFSGKAQEDNILLAWQTASEQDNAGFEIERSENGKQFKTLDFVVGNGNTLEIQRYQWTDESPITGTNYYRLKQLDYNGQYEYSQILAIAFGVQKEQDFSIFPNPTNSILNIQSIDNQLIESISIFDVNGRLVLAIDTGNSQVDLSNLPNGIYALQIKTRTTLHQTYIAKE